MASIVGIADEINETLYETFTGDATLAALVTGVYDDVPDSTAYPYIVMGEAYVTKDATFNKDGRSVLNRLHIWSQYQGSKECWQIMDRIGVLLDEATITVDGATIISCEVEAANIVRDPDGVTRHGVVDIRTLAVET